MSSNPNQSPFDFAFRNRLQKSPSEHVVFYGRFHEFDALPKDADIGVYEFVLKLPLRVTKLLDLDIASKSDPMVVVYMKKRDGTLEEIGRTKVILNNLNPSWIEKLPVTYQFEIVQPLMFHIYDVDTRFHNMSVKIDLVKGIVRECKLKASVSN